MTTTDSSASGCLTALLRLVGVNLGTPAAAGLPYRMRDDFLSAAELSFYRVLRTAVGERGAVLAKVNLGDVFFVSRPNENAGARNKIDRKHVDFLVCDAGTLRPLAGVELDDASHRRADRVERDRFVDEVFAAAGLPLVRVPAGRTYDPRALAAELAPHLDARPAAPPAISAPPASNTPPACPKCGVPMVRRVAAKSGEAGRAFWGCPHYPRCRATVPG